MSEEQTTMSFNGISEPSLHFFPSMEARVAILMKLSQSLCAGPSLNGTSGQEYIFAQYAFEYFSEASFGVTGLHDEPKTIKPNPKQIFIACFMTEPFKTKRQASFVPSVVPTQNLGTNFFEQKLSIPNKKPAELSQRKPGGGTPCAFPHFPNDKGLRQVFGLCATFPSCFFQLSSRSSAAPAWRSHFAWNINEMASARTVQPKKNFERRSPQSWAKKPLALTAPKRCALPFGE